MTASSSATRIGLHEKIRAMLAVSYTHLFHAYGFVMILLGVKLASSRMRTTTAGAAAPA